jgi:hypothetical protein
VKQPLRSAIIAIAIQYFAMVLGLYWAWAGFVLCQPWLIPGGWADFILRLLLFPQRLAGWLPIPTVRGIGWTYMYHAEGCLAAVALGIEGLRFVATPRLRRDYPWSIWLCLLLACYLVLLMCIEPFFCYNDVNFITGVLLVTPLLFAVNALVRWRAWVGLSAVVLFFATSIAMMSHNGCSRGGMTGFFEAFVY